MSAKVILTPCDWGAFKSMRLAVNERAKRLGSSEPARIAAIELGRKLMAAGRSSGCAVQFAWQALHDPRSVRYEFGGAA